MHDTTAFFFSCMSENGRRGLKFTPLRGGEREGRWVFPDPDGFSGLEIFFFPFDYWELGVRVIFLFGDRILDVMGLVCE
jgi:hypothetical protein